MKINILGTEYSYCETTDKEDNGLIGNDGYCDGYAKIISIETGHNWNEPNSIQDREAMYKKIKRHEIVHAFFNESGLMEMSQNELLVDWIAAQFPKMYEAFEMVGANESKLDNTETITLADMAGRSETTAKG